MQIGTTRTLIGLLILAGAIFILNKIALDHYLYWYFWWYDIVMHFITGAAVGGLAAWGAVRFDHTVSRRDFCITVFLSIMAIGVGWEIFEYVNGWYVEEARIVLDVTLDLIMDTIGAFGAAFLVKRILRKDPVTYR